jgi:UDP-2,3-diacylglucosamine pyrophosphatase LpxH
VPTTLVINGDFIDFDTVTSVPDDGSLRPTRIERKRGLRPSPERSAYKMQVVLADHAPFFERLARFILAGNDVVYVLGNHDREMCFPAVQEVLVARLAGFAEDDAGRDRIRSHMRFEPWFYYVEDLLWVEHGHQYDRYCSFHFLLNPVISRLRRDGELDDELLLPFGSLTARFLGNGLGTFNPYTWKSFILGGWGYVRHWLRHYFLRPRSLLLTFLLGSLRILWEIVTLRAHVRELSHPGERDRIDLELERIAERQAIATERLLRVAERWKAPLVLSAWSVVHELALDRLLLFLVLAAVTVGLGLTALPLSVTLGVPAVMVPALFLLYEQIVHTGGGVEAEFEGLEHFAREVAHEIGVPYVVFGHSHDPRTVPLGETSTYYNVGTWAPVFEDAHCTLPVPGLRRYLLFMQRGGDVDVQFGTWEAKR